MSKVGEYFREMNWQYNDNFWGGFTAPNDEELQHDMDTAYAVVHCLMTIWGIKYDSIR